MTASDNLFQVFKLIVIILLILGGLIVVMMIMDEPGNKPSCTSQNGVCMEQEVCPDDHLYAPFPTCRVGTICCIPQ